MNYRTIHDPRVIIALDLTLDAALALSARLEPQDCRLKVGKELFTATGPVVVEKLLHRGFDVFLDLKFHDIPNTVAGACRAAAELGVWMINVHALGGSAMLDAARKSIDSVRGRRPLLIAVTVLTSMTDDDLPSVGIEGPLAMAAVRLAILAKESGLDGVVCSAQEAPLIRRECGQQFRLVTPGIRLQENAHDDQQRVTTPAAAITAGADYLVVGRPVTQAADPVAVLTAINLDIQSVWRAV